MSRPYAIRRLPKALSCVGPHRRPGCPCFRGDGVAGDQPLSGRGPALRDRVLAASRELGFVPKVQRPTIAVVIGQASPFSPVSYVSSMLAALVKELARHNFLAEVVDMEHLDPAKRT